jgi:hypothetical protein
LQKKEGLIFSFAGAPKKNGRAIMALPFFLALSTLPDFSFRGNSCCGPNPLLG